MVVFFFFTGSRCFLKVLQSSLGFRVSLRFSWVFRLAVHLFGVESLKDFVFWSESFRL